MQVTLDDEADIGTQQQRALLENEMFYLAFYYLEISFNWKSSMSSRVESVQCKIQGKVNCVLYICNSNFFTLLTIREIVDPTL